MSQAAEARRPAARSSGFADRSLFNRFLSQSPSRPRSPARGGAGRVAGAIRNLRRRPLRRGQGNARRSGDVLFKSRRGPQRFRARNAVAPAEPRARARPAGARSRPRRAQPRAVGDGDAFVARPLRRGRGGAGRRTRPQRPFRRGRRLRRSLPDDGAAGRRRLVERGPRASAVLCGDGVQHVRPRQRAAPRRAGADGAACRMDRPAVQARNARERRHRSDDPRRGGRGRSDAAGGGAAGAFHPERRLRHHRAWHRRGDALTRPQSGPVRVAPRRSIESARRLRGGGQAGNRPCKRSFARRRATSSSAERRSPRARKC